jgi:hypothetical protein
MCYPFQLKPEIHFNREMAFFDVDSLEYYDVNSCGRASVWPNLAFRPRVMQRADILNTLYNFIKHYRFPFVFSICCSGRSPLIRDMPEVLHIPAESNKKQWREHVSDHSIFLIQKAHTDHIQGNFLDEMYAKFIHNDNLPEFYQQLGVKNWVVFGNGAAFCVYPVIMTLMNAGMHVTILSDVLIDNASGYTEQSPEFFRMEMLKNCEQAGASVVSFKDFFSLAGMAYYH